MKKKECPSCAMEVDATAKECPICQYEFTRTAAGWRWLALALAIFFIVYLLIVTIR